MLRHDVASHIKAFCRLALRRSHRSDLSGLSQVIGQTNRTESIIENTLGRMNFRTLTLGAILVVGLFTWPAANTLFAGPGAQSADLIARGVAFAILAASYAVFIAALLYVVRLFPRAWASPWRLLLVSILAVVGSFLAPLASLPSLFVIYTVCTQPSFPCANPDFLSLVPHALRVAAYYPGTQVLVAVPALALLLWFGLLPHPKDTSSGSQNAP